MDAELLKILVCPRCRGPLEAAEDELTCPSCALAYPVRDGIPVMLVDSARELS